LRSAPCAAFQAAHNSNITGTNHYQHQSAIIDALERTAMFAIPLQRQVSGWHVSSIMYCGRDCLNKQPIAEWNRWDFFLFWMTSQCDDGIEAGSIRGHDQLGERAQLRRLGRRALPVGLLSAHRHRTQCQYVFFVCLFVCLLHFILDTFFPLFFLVLVLFGFDFSLFFPFLYFSGSFFF
jgi:hypothetical protein